MKPVALINLNTGRWVSTQNKDWTELYFVETVLDLSLFKHCKAKLYVETLHREKEGGELRLAWQQAPSKWNPFQGSEIVTRKKNSGHWQLMESEWFTVPYIPDVSCLWVQGKAAADKEQISVALATVVFAVDNRQTV